MTENGQKWPKNRVFGHFKKIISLVMSGIGVKRTFLWLINILQKLDLWEKYGSKIMSKTYVQKLCMLSASEISLFFYSQYFINKLIS